MFMKHKMVLPLFVTIVGDKKVSQLKQADVNDFFEVVQKLPTRDGAMTFASAVFGGGRHLALPLHCGPRVASGSTRASRTKVEAPGAGF